MVNFFLNKILFSEPIVEAEFFDPKYRSELERRDAEIVRKTGKGPASGDEWVWLTQYCRIPVRFCILYFKNIPSSCFPTKLFRIIHFHHNFYDCLSFHFHVRLAIC